MKLSNPARSYVNQLQRDGMERLNTTNDKYLHFSDSPHKEGRGIIFDHHYTDSLLKILLPNCYASFPKWLPTKRSVPRKDILLSLLLFGKAVLSKPLWLNQGELHLKGKEQRLWAQVESEGLIEWVPDSYYGEAFAKLANFNNLLSAKADEFSESLPTVTDSYGQALCQQSADVMGRFPHLNHEDDEDAFYLSYFTHACDFRRGNPYRGIRELDIGEFIAERDSELASDLWVALNALVYSSPVISSNLKHVNFQGDPTWLLIDPWFSKETTFWPPVFAHEEVLSELREGSFLSTLKSVEDLDFPTYYSTKYSSLSVVLDALLSSLAVERMASSSGLPVKTAGAGDHFSVPHGTVGDEAYQLLKVQYKELRYPVIETMTDVLRLRENKHLESYRTVITEYSNRMREELETERVKVLEDFKKDLELASKALFSTHKWDSRIADWTFYISLPLTVVSFLSGLPISDALLIPTTGGAKYVKKKKLKELDWLMFGTP